MFADVVFIYIYIYINPGDGKRGTFQHINGEALRAVAVVDFGTSFRA